MMASAVASKPRLDRHSRHSTWSDPASGCTRRNLSASPQALAAALRSRNAAAAATVRCSVTGRSCTLLQTTAVWAKSLTGAAPDCGAHTRQRCRCKADLFMLRLLETDAVPASRETACCGPEIGA